MFFVQLRIAPQNPKTPRKKREIINGSAARDESGGFGDRPESERGPSAGTELREAVQAETVQRDAVLFCAARASV